jgi:hypothetical protein
MNLLYRKPRLTGAVAWTVQGGGRKQGFQTKIVQPVEVNVDAHVQVNVALDVKGTQEIVTVDAKGAQIEADSSIEYTSFSWTSQLAF